MSPSRAVQIHYNGDDGWYVTMSCWPWTNRKYVYTGVCLNLKVLLVFDAVRGRNVTLM